MPTGLRASARGRGTGWASVSCIQPTPGGDFGALPPSSLQEQELLEEALSTLDQSSARVPTL